MAWKYLRTLSGNDNAVDDYKDMSRTNEFKLTPIVGKYAFRVYRWVRPIH